MHVCVCVCVGGGKNENLKHKIYSQTIFKCQPMHKCGTKLMEMFSKCKYGERVKKNTAQTLSFEIQNPIREDVKSRAVKFHGWLTLSKNCGGCDYKQKLVHSFSNKCNGFRLSEWHKTRRRRKKSEV